MTPAAPVASLRVYEPLAAFSQAHRERFAALVVDGVAPERQTTARLERTVMLRTAVGHSLRVPGAAEGGYLLVEDGLTKLCPWDLQLRVWESFEAVAAGLPTTMVDAFVPPQESARAVSGLADLRSRGGTAAVAHIQTATWAVPLRWFLAFEPGERLVVAEPGSDGRRELLYRTSMAAARRRMARSLSVIRRTIPDGGVAAEVTALARWLAEFHAFSTVELDYGDLARLVDAEDLLADTSAADVAEAVAHLADGDGDGAARSYVRAVLRWRALAGTALAN